MPEAHPAPGTRHPALPDEVGGEVRIGRGGGPRWLRFWYYLVYVWAILYLLIEDVDRYWMVAAFGGLLIVWLGYIAWKKKPPEP
jgi:hypothetical protein